MELFGMMSEAELHVLRSRLLLGKRNKARRGEAFGFVPTGYVRTADGGVALDPDEQARAAVRLVFEKFAELGSARQAHAYLVRNGIALGVRSFAGPDKGQLTWRRPRLWAVYEMLRHPFYAGAYVYGRCVVDPTRRTGGTSGRRSARPEEWISLIRDKVPAYITWEQYEENRRRLSANHSGRVPSAHGRRAETLLNRLARCGRCGGPMVADRTHEARGPRYTCDPRHHEAGGSACQSVTAIPVDRLIGSLVLDAVSPAGLELSLRVAESAGRDRDRLRAVWRQKIERATYEADRARRQYDAAEPENRLVARELERRWEEALAAKRQVEEDFARFEADQGREMSAADRERVRALAADVPALWSSPTTCAADRREVVRLLVERVELTRHGETEVIDVTVHWRGGAVSRHQVRQRVRGYAQLDRVAALRVRLVELRGAGWSSPQIADALNADGFALPRGDAFTADMVRRLCRQFGLTERPATPEDGEPRAGEWWLPALATELGVARSVLYRWRQNGYITARRRAGTPTEWIVWADAAERRRLRKLRAFEECHRCHKPPAELTTPSRPESKSRGRGAGSSPARKGGT
jgi:hypothetical protein